MRRASKYGGLTISFIASLIDSDEDYAARALARFFARKYNRGKEADPSYLGRFIFDVLKRGRRDDYLYDPAFQQRPDRKPKPPAQQDEWLDAEDG